VIRDFAVQDLRWTCFLKRVRSTFDQDAAKGLDVTTCFSWYGRPLRDTPWFRYRCRNGRRKASLLTVALDSGIPRCEWHRVRLDADIPTGTTLTMSVASTENPNAAAQGDPQRSPAWQTFPPAFRIIRTGPLPAGSVRFPDRSTGGACI